MLAACEGFRSFSVGSVICLLLVLLKEDSFLQRASHHFSKRMEPPLTNLLTIDSFSSPDLHWVIENCHS